MYQWKEEGPERSRKLDAVHIVLGIVIVVMALVAFVQPSENMVLFPLIFFFASLLQWVRAGFYLTWIRRERKSYQYLAPPLIKALLLLGVSIVAAISIW